MKKLIRAIKAWFKKRRERERFEREAEIKSEFRIVEKSGMIWILCGSRAIMRFSTDGLTKEITDKLVDCRATAVSYESL